MRRRRARNSDIPRFCIRRRRDLTRLTQQYGRPEVLHTPAPTYHGGGTLFGRSEVAAISHPGAPQVMHPGAPAVVGRRVPAGVGKGAPQIAARPVIQAKPESAGSAPQQERK
jgi:hypothetical protein